MKILVAGNQGYVGPVLGRHLRRVFPDAELIGFDTGYFAHCLTDAALSPERVYDAQLHGDVRDLDAAAAGGRRRGRRARRDLQRSHGRELRGGDRRGQSRRDRAAGANSPRRRASSISCSRPSCSVYGFAPGAARRESDPLNPQTAYARSKIAIERALAPMDLGGMTTTCLRFATACGMSERLRLDLVLNDFVASAIAARRDHGAVRRHAVAAADRRRRHGARHRMGADARARTRAAAAAQRQCRRGRLELSGARSRRGRGARRARRQPSASTKTRRRTRDLTRSTFRSTARWRPRISRR